MQLYPQSFVPNRWPMCYLCIKITYIATKSQSFLKILTQQRFLLLYFLFFSLSPSIVLSYACQTSHHSAQMFLTPATHWSLPQRAPTPNIPHWSNRINNWINYVSKHSLTLNYTTPSLSSPPFSLLVYIWFYFYIC